MAKEALDKFKEELKRNDLSELTIQNYAWFVDKFLKVNNKKPEELTEEDANKFLTSIVESKSSSTANLAIAAIKLFFSQVLNKPIKLTLPQQEKKSPEILTKQEIKNLIDSAETNKSKLLIKFLYSSGLKVSELVNLKLSDVNLNQNCGKSKVCEKKEKFFLFADKLSTEIKEFLENHPQYSYVFSKEKPLSPRNVQKIIKTAAIKAKIQKKVTPHSLRHAHISHAVILGLDNQKLKEIEKEISIPFQPQPGQGNQIPSPLKKFPNPLDDVP